jgi:uncharacterized membrane protein YeaQ/YmgE (transglycosylase-associated protein family)
MNAQQLIVMAVVGIIAGWLAGLVVGGIRFGILGNLIIGVIGSFVGGFIFDRAGWRLNLGNEVVDQIVIAAIGAIVLIVIARLINLI